MPGWLVATDGPLTVALDIEISDDLKKEGVARELINRIQNVRKDSGFEVTDKVKVLIFAPSSDDKKEIASSLSSYEGYVASQTLADSVSLSDTDLDGAADVEWNEGKIRLLVKKQ